MERVFDSFDVTINGWVYSVEVEATFCTSDPDEIPKFVISEFDKDGYAPEPSEAEVLQEIYRKHETTDWGFFLNQQRELVDSREKMYG